MSTSNQGIKMSKINAINPFSQSPALQRVSVQAASSGVIPRTTRNPNTPSGNPSSGGSNNYVGLASNNPNITNQYSSIYGKSNVSNTLGIA